MIEEAESLQKMQNMIQTKQYSKALEIALRLGRPGNAFDTLKLLSQDEIHSLVKKLSNTNKFKLLEFWNGLQKKIYDECYRSGKYGPPGLQPVHRTPIVRFL